MRPEMAVETKEVHKHRSRARVQKSEQRKREEDEGNKGKLDCGEVQEHREGNEVRKQQCSYNTLKALAKTQQHTSAVIEDGSGNILTESTVVLYR